jgi:O-antigen/teichoic acid export membrane protein
LAYYGYGVWALVAQTISNQVFLVVIMWFTVRWRPIIAFSFSCFKELFSFGWKIFCTNFIITLFVRIRILIIGKFFSPSTLAYFEKGEQFPGLIMNNVCGSIQTVIFPAFSEAQDDSAKVRAMMRRAINLSCLFMFPMMICLMVAAKPLVIILLTEKWIDVVPYMQILCIANFFRPITIPNQQAITALGYSGITLKLEIIKKIVDVSILIVSCYFGAIAIAWGVVLFNFACIFINLAPNVRLLDYKIHDQIIDIFPTFLISLFMGVSIIWVPLMSWNPMLQLLVICIISIVTFTLFCRILRIEGFMYLYSLLKERFSNNKLYR